MVGAKYLAWLIAATSFDQWAAMVEKEYMLTDRFFLRVAEEQLRVVGPAGLWCWCILAK